MRRNRTMNRKPSAAPGARRRAAAAGREGIVIPVVLALLSLLMVLGFFFFSFSNQESTNAEYFSDASKRPAAPGLDPNTCFNWALRQVIMGADESEGQSPLFRGRHSIVPNLLGRDLHPYSGPGLNVVYDYAGIGTLIVDQDRDGTADAGAGQDPLEINDSPAAWGSTQDLTNYPDPDVDHTYPGINSAFLAYIGYAPGSNGKPVRVIIPSFHRPAYLRYNDSDDDVLRPCLPEDLDGDGFLDAGEDVNGNGVLDDWYANPATATRVMRPHTAHRALRPDGTVSANARFITKAEYDLDPNGWAAQGITGPFPIAAEDANGAAGAYGEQGVWSVAPWRADTPYGVGRWVVPVSPNGLYYECTTAGTSGSSPPTTWSQTPGGTTGDGSVVWTARDTIPDADMIHEYDVDADGDDIKEAIWMDLGFPVQTLADGTRIVPMFAVTIYDADGLLNLIAHGNVNFPVTQYDFDTQFRNSTQAFGGANFLSRSNQGISPAEVNPLYALNARVGADGTSADVQQLQYYFNRMPQDHSPLIGPTGAFLETANMEWWLYNTGRLEMEDADTPAREFEGRYGEVGLLLPAWQNRERLLFSGPGQSRTDDNPLNRNHGESYLYYPADTTGARDLLNRQMARDYTADAPSFPSQPPALAQLYPFGHPLDFRGAGTPVSPASFTAAGGKAQLQWYAANNPNRFPGYQDYHTRGTAGWGRYLGGALMVDANNQPYLTTRFTDQLVDEAWELTVGGQGGYDSETLQRPGELAFLQMSDSEIQAYGVTSDAASRMEFNLQRNSRAREIRKRFTTVSWDAKVQGKPFWNQTAAGFRSWEYENVDNADPATDRFMFPPTFSVTAGEDPIRPQVRQWLQTIARRDGSLDGTTDYDGNGRVDHRDQVQRLLSVNHVLDDATDGARSTAGFDDPEGKVQFRDLTEHPATLGDQQVPPLVAPDMTGNNTWNPNVAFPPQDDYAREHWARRDRQMLARDIYVLLYLLGGGQDGVDVTQTANTIDPADTTGNTRAVYDESQLEQMAQFAINLVNSLDRDIVIDKFAYDKDLSNGWTPFDPYGTPPTAGSEVGVVTGVEMPLLTLNEALAVNTAKFREQSTMQDKDLPATQWGDTEEWLFSYLELHNVSPATVSVASGDWLIEVADAASEDTPAPADDLPKRYMLLREPDQGAIPSGEQLAILSGLSQSNKYIAADDDGDGVIDANELTRAPSYLAVDQAFVPGGTPNFGAAGDRIAPFFAGNYTLDPVGDNWTSDIFTNLDSPAASAINSPTTPAALLQVLPEGSPARTDAGTIVPGAPSMPAVRIRLHRRAYLGRAKPSGGPDASYNRDNPWVEVDRIQIGNADGFRRIQVTSNSAADQVTGQEVHDKFKTDNVASNERVEPLNRNDDQLWDATLAGTADDARRNTLGGQNSQNKRITYPLNPTTMAPVFPDGSSPLIAPSQDRDFASVVELFDVPLYGPGDLTASLRPTGNTAYTEPPAPQEVQNAGPQKFLSPRDRLNRGAAKYDNRWYRLLSLVEVPTPVSAADDIRMPGRINWNTIRFPEVLAGLIDDPAAFVFNVLDGNDTTWLTDRSGENRDWWLQFVESRDGVDPLTLLRLAGTAVARPFRGFDSVVPPSDPTPSDPTDDQVVANDSINDTMLRALPADVNANPTDPTRWRRLFELATVAEHGDSQTNNGTSDLPMYESAKHRLLAKMLGNSTTRSNVFFAFVHVEFFEAAEMTDGSVRIGGKSADSPVFRGFFVLDRTKALELVRPENLPGGGAARERFTFEGNSQFDYQSVIVYP